MLTSTLNLLGFPYYLGVKRTGSFCISWTSCDRDSLSILSNFFLQYILVKYLFFARICHRNRNIGITKTNKYLQEVLIIQCTRQMCEQSFQAL